MEWITTHWDDIVTAILAVHAAAAAIAALTPTPKDDNVVRKLRKFIDVLGFNVRHARNKES